MRRRSLILVASLLLSCAAQAQSVPAPGAAGWTALQAGDAERAAGLFADALRRNPRDAASQFGAGAAAHLLGRDDQAISDLSRALTLDPALIGASELLGLLYHQRGDVEAALRTYELALARAPGAGTPAMRARLDDWRKEAALHATLAERNDARFAITFDGRSDQALASRASAVLERAYWTIAQRLGAYPPSRVLVTLYTEQQFRDISHAPAWSGGLFDGRIRIPVKGAAQNLDEFDRVLVHELTHAMIHGLAPRGVPAWMHEGLAGLFEPRDPALAQRRLQALGVAVPLSALDGGFGALTPPQAMVAYDASLCAADLLMRLANGRIALLLQALGSGQSLDAGFGQLGLRKDDFEAQLARRLRP